MVNQAGTHMYVPINKCGSNSLKRVFPTYKRDDFPSLGTDIPGFAIVRHPVDRWFSGIGEVKRHSNFTYEELIKRARNGIFLTDNHTRPQWEFVRPYPHIELVKMEYAETYIRTRFGRKFPHVRKGDWEPVEDLVDGILEFYAKDLEIYQAALPEMA